MIRPDCIVSWPSHLDYPLWRQLIRDNRGRFSRVIVVFTNHFAEWDYRDFVRGATQQDDLSFLENDVVAGDQDWRNVAVNKGLKLSNAQWVWFTEEDFFPRVGFWEEADRLFDKSDVFGVDVQGRLHPCCIFAKRATVDRTSKNFGVLRDRLDHFGIFQSEIGNYSSFDPKYYYHVSGVSQNMWKLMNGEKPSYNEGEFKEYCKKCLEVEVPIHKDYVKLFNEYLL